VECKQGWPPKVKHYQIKKNRIHWIVYINSCQ